MSGVVLEKFKGCLLGGACGDALGYVVEFLSAEEIKRKYGTLGIEEYEYVFGRRNYLRS